MIRQGIVEFKILNENIMLEAYYKILYQTAQNQSVSSVSSFVNSNTNISG